MMNHFMMMMMMMDWGHPIFQHPREARRGVGRRCGRIF
jgi:hypothetical protein